VRGSLRSVWVRDAIIHSRHPHRPRAILYKLKEAQVSIEMLGAAPL